MELGKHIYAVQNLLNKGPRSDDSRYSDALIAHFLKTARTILIKRKLDKFNDVEDTNMQVLCIELELGPYHTCPDIPVDCSYLQSKEAIPAVLSNRFKSTLRVEYLDGRPIPETTLSANRYNKYSKTRRGRPGWFIHNGFLYIINECELPAVLIKGIFADPEEVANAESDGEACEMLEIEFPIDGDLVAPMYEMTLQLMGSSLQMPNDKENNAADTEVVNDKE